MKLVIAFLLVLVATTATVLGQTSAETKLRQLEREWNEAIVTKNFTVLDQTLADEFVYIDPIGGVNPKAEMLRGLKNSEAVIEPFTTEDVVVRVYGDTAVVTGRFTQVVKLKDQSFRGQFRYTDVYVRHGGTWRAVSAHSSRIPDKK
jgi:ketosteroid isomerase-like protein